MAISLSDLLPSGKTARVLPHDFKVPPFNWNTKKQYAVYLNTKKAKRKMVYLKPHTYSFLIKS
jgi:hypothetical protein